MASDPAAAAAHVLIFPYPSQGPINGMLKLAELLAMAGLHVSFLNTEYSHRRLHLCSASPPQLPLLRFLSIPDGLPDDYPRDAARLIDIAESLSTKSSIFFRELLLKMLRPDSVAGFPPVTCLIADGFMPFAVDVAEELGIPSLSCRTPSACSIWAYLCIPKLLQAGELPFPGGADLDEPVRGVPGMEGFLRRRDLPAVFKQAKRADDPHLQFLKTVTDYSRKARGFILNSTETLEGSSLSHIRSHIPVTYAVGPLHAMIKPSRSGDDTPALTASLWSEDSTCIQWLDSQPDRSVVYVSFGSLTVLTKEELVQFRDGLVGSNRRFLWVLRPDMVRGSGWTDEIVASLPERGRVVNWAPQEHFLAHRAVGCFFTHCGWNSTLESVVEGVPMLCWPFFLDQQINSRFVSEVWRIGLDMKDQCDRQVVKTMLREMMEGETAARIRKSAAELAAAVTESFSEGGSSFKEFQRLVNDIKSMSN